jgi:hypothetical protein
MSRLPIRPAVLAAGAAGLSYAALRQRPPGGEGTWSRTNHRGEPVTLLEGPAVAIGGMAGALAAPGLTGRDRAAMLVAGTAAAALGGYDDLAGRGSSRGFRGHLGALRHGELTTGAVKLIGIGAAGLAASALLGPADGGRRGLAGADLVINAGLVAGGANLMNLFDLRPGRAIKVALLSGGLLSVTSQRGRTAAAAPLGASAALLVEDLGERAMLGDAGANALGALLGTAAATGLPRAARVVTLAVVVGLTAASEVVSFTKVIERTGPLRWLDMLGRRPAPARHRGTGLGGRASRAAGPGWAGSGPAGSGPAGPGASAASGPTAPAGVRPR